MGRSKLLVAASVASKASIEKVRMSTISIGEIGGEYE